MKILKGFISVISFLTIIPVNSSNIEEIAYYAYFFPLVGAIIGTISGLFGTILFIFFPKLLAGLLTLFCLLIITGLHHLDGVLDLGDAIMFRGSKNEKLKILHDKHHGIGGFFLLYAVLSMSFILISLIKNILISLIIAETFAKLSILLVSFIGKPCEFGIGKIFIVKFKEKKYRNIVLGSLLPLVIIIINPKVFIIFISIILFSVIWTNILHKIFNCISGDMLGCTNEFSRIICLLLLLLMGF
ncbi:MAG: adenosylcobinamide-GDP ribazoletransferase [Candidatus Verstraetearchaeota archaeon]|jgi:adenosylcobinamide-GDP ribazoletransferase|nr:adenosylcobinamide-GDP ribazoletransferase [Candidatus Verstraetearchaeota archaeon]